MVSGDVGYHCVISLMMGKTGSLSSKSNKKDKELENNFLKFVDI
jgi:hypothetical protein